MSCTLNCLLLVYHFLFSVFFDRKNTGLEHIHHFGSLRIRHHNLIFMRHENMKKEQHSMEMWNIKSSVIFKFTFNYTCTVHQWTSPWDVLRLSNHGNIFTLTEKIKHLRTSIFLSYQTDVFSLF